MAPAVVDGERMHTYQQLHELSSQLAERLGQIGAAAGDIVGLYSDRSLEWVVGMLAILKIGAVYLPLHPELPQARRRLLLREAGVKHVLMHPHLHNDFKELAATLSIDVSQESALEGSRDEQSDDQLHRSDRACVLFTSGTTGTPKGVVVRQSSIRNLVSDTNYIQLTATDRIAFASNTAFDAATFEVWGALLNGSCMVVIPPATLLSPALLEITLRRQAISTLFLTTALLNAIARSCPTALGGLRWLLFGGEEANPDCVRAILFSGDPPAHLLHVYGPTECTTFSTFHPVCSLARDVKTIPIGEPIKGCSVHVVDDQLRPTVVGDEGELCVSGCGLAEGYLGRPRETDSAFRSISIDGVETRIYCTGDRARLRADGQLEYLGRRDNQIKLRGFRIETAEIESVFCEHDAVVDAIVLLYAGPGGASRLGAAIQTRAEDVDRLIRELAAISESQLPEAMRPARIHAYQEFPLTPSKKVDRQRLCAELGEEDDQTNSQDRNQTWQSKRTTEGQLAEIWKDILGRLPAGSTENFFEAGGDSLQAFTMQMRIEKQWKTVLPPTFLLEHASFGSILAYLNRSRPGDIQPVVWLTGERSRPVMACMPGVYGHVFSYRNLLPFWPAGKGLCALPSRYLRSDGERRLLTMEDLAQESIANLNQAGVSEIDAIAGYSFGGLLAYEMACQLAKAGQAPALILLDTVADQEESRGLSKRTRVRLELTHALTRRSMTDGARVPGMLMSASAANFTAVKRYRPGPFPGSMLLIRASLARVPKAVDMETLGWGELVRGGLIVDRVDADHANILKPPHVAEIAARTLGYLREHSNRWM